MLVAAPSAEGQVRLSEAATISQTVDGTVITVSYSRPQARGRDSLFGKQVRHGEPWTPGANWATTLEVSKDVRIEGHPVRKGTYSVWLVPDAGEWTVILDREARRFHTQRPDASNDQIRFSVRPDSGSHTETLTWDVPIVRREGMALRFRWASLAVTFDVAVEPTGRGRRAGAWDAYVGTYRLRLIGEAADTSDVRLDVFDDDGTLRVRLTPNPFGDGEKIELANGDAPHAFSAYLGKGARVREGEREAELLFLVRHGRATGIELRGARGQVIGTAMRVD